MTSGNRWRPDAAGLGPRLHNIIKRSVEGFGAGVGEGDSEERGDEEGGGQEGEGGADAVAFGEGADEEWGGGGEDAAGVVAETHGGGANFAGEDFGGHRGIAGEVAGTEEGDDRAEDEEQTFGVNHAVDGDEDCGEREIEEVRFFAAPHVGNRTEDDVAQPLSAGQYQEKCGGSSEADAAAALRDGQRKIRGNPSKQTPEAEEAEGVHCCGDRAEAQRLWRQHAEDGFSRCGRG